MVSQETLSGPAEPASTPRISFSADFLDEKTFISISPSPGRYEKERARREEFEFLSTDNSLTEEMLSADELFFEGKLLPFFQTHQCEKLNKINVGDQERVEETREDRIGKDESNGNAWFIDEDPSPRPPSCTVLWKELLRLKKQNASLSHSSSSSSSSSVADIEEGKREKSVKRIYKKTTSIRIRPVVNVPICSHVRSSGLPPLFSSKKGKLES